MLLLVLLLVGTIIQSLTMIRSGLLYDFGLGFWGPNAHDGVWHLALISQMLRSFPPLQPTFSGYLLTNYHFVFDGLLAVTNLVTKIPVSFLYFQVFPVLLSLTLGILSFKVGYLWKKNYWTGFWLAFLNYFAGSFGFMITLLKDKSWGGESIFWSMQSISTLINPPFALSLVVLLLGMLIILKSSSFSWGKSIILGTVFGILIGIKSYAGVVGLAGFFFYCLLKFKEQKKLFFSFLLSLGIFLLILILTSKNAQSLFLFKPFWFINTMVESPDRLYWYSLAIKIGNLKTQLGIKLIFFELVALLIFILGNLGTRAVGFISIIKNKKEAFDYFLLTIAAVGFIIPLLLVQKGTPWNTIQFFYYTLFAFNFFTADIFSCLSKKKTSRVLLIAFLLLLTLPTTLSSFKGYLGWPPPARVSLPQQEALEFLANQSDGAVLTFPFDEAVKNKERKTPVLINEYETTAYVTAYSGKQTFLADEMNLEIMQVDWRERKAQVQNFFNSDNLDDQKSFLKENNIAYVFLEKGEKLPNLSRGLLVPIYEKEGISIFKSRLGNFD